MPYICMHHNQSHIHVHVEQRYYRSHPHTDYWRIAGGLYWKRFSECRRHLSAHTPNRTHRNSTSSSTLVSNNTTSDSSVMPLQEKRVRLRRLVASFRHSSCPPVKSTRLKSNVSRQGSPLINSIPLSSDNSQDDNPRRVNVDIHDAADRSFGPGERKLR